MRKTILYIAASLDGYIADSTKSVNWIKGQDDSIEMLDTYTPFFATVDTVIMGKRTYKQIITELSPEHWPYSGVKTYIFTHELQPDTDDIKFISSNPCPFVNDLKQVSGKNIWICGGADIINQLIKEDLIDVFHITTIPIILGGGVRLFNETNYKMKLKLINTMNYNGIIESVYEREENSTAR